MLFYYFKNKSELYNFLVDYSIECFQDYFSRITLLKENDLIEKFRNVNKYKMETMFKYPKVINFISMHYLSQNENNVSETANKSFEILVGKAQQIKAFIYESIDTSLFRIDISPEKIINYIRWSMDGYIQDITNRVKGEKLTSIDYQKYLSEFDEFMDNLKVVYYKN